LGFKVNFIQYFLINSFQFILSKIGEEQTSDDAEDGPPELLVRKID
jgi:hypothetical protein